MLEFNKEHKFADLSEIKEKDNKIKNFGKIAICGIVVSAVLLFSGCSDSNLIEEVEAKDKKTSTAIIIENGNALIVDVDSYSKYVDDKGNSAYQDTAIDETWVLYTTTGDKILINSDCVKFIEGENSHEKAEALAEVLIEENGKINCYNELESYGKTK